MNPSQRRIGVTATAASSSPNAPIAPARAVRGAAPDFRSRRDRVSVRGACRGCRECPDTFRQCQNRRTSPARNPSTARSSPATRPPSTTAWTYGLGRVDPHVLEREIHRLAGRLVDEFAESGGADLVGQYARLLLLVFNRLFGLADAAGFRLLDVLRRLVSGADADRAGEDLARYMSELVSAKRADPGDDITTWLTGHRARLRDEELVHQLMLIIAAGNAPTADLLANALRMVLTERGASAGADRGIDRGVEEVVDRVLWQSPHPAARPRRAVPAPARRACWWRSAGRWPGGH